MNPKQKNPINTQCKTVCASLLLAASICLNAGESPTPKASSPEFDRLKTPVGTWKGETDMGQGPMEIIVRYRLLAGGSVLEERVFEGTPNEMVTMYYQKDGTLAMTHYCMMGNRPAMLLKSSDTKSLTFDFDKSCGIIPAKESHMHAMKIQFQDADTISTSCKANMEGKELPEHPTTLKRVKS